MKSVVMILLTAIAIASCASTRHIYKLTKDTFTACADTWIETHIRAFQSVPSQTRLQLLSCGRADPSFIPSTGIVAIRMCCSYRSFAGETAGSWLTGISIKDKVIGVVEHPARPTDCSHATWGECMDKRRTLDPSID